MRNLIIFLMLIFPTVVIASTTDIDISLANGQVQDAVDAINLSNARIASLQENINYNQGRINEWNAEIALLEQKIEEKKAGITYVATKADPVESAIEVLNANPDWAVGINWSEYIPELPAVDYGSVNWSTTDTLSQ